MFVVLTSVRVVFWIEAILNTVFVWLIVLFFVIGDSYIKHVGLEFHLGDNSIVFEQFTASIGDLMAAN